MIGYVKGLLAEIEEGCLTIDVGGLGYRVLVGASTIGRMPAIGSEVKLFTYTSVKEDSITLYGFGSHEELDLYKKLITVSGIGPKVGLALLSVLEPSELRFAIYSADVKTISKVPGVGKKTAERLILELKDKVPLDMPAGEEGIRLLDDESAGQDLMNNQRDAVEALVALGYSPTQATRAVRDCKPDESMSADDILKKSLKYLI